jgi:hypothetical protein
MSRTAHFAPLPDSGQSSVHGRRNTCPVRGGGGTHDRAPDSPAPSSVEGDQHSLISADRKSQDVYSVRDKNSGKGHKTADKWNQ